MPVRAPLSALALVAVIGCGGPEEQQDLLPTEGAVTLEVSMALATEDKCGTVRASAHISGPDMFPIGPVALEPTEQSWRAAIPDVIPGPERRITVTAFDGDDQAVHEGEVVVDIAEEAPAPVEITAFRNLQTCPLGADESGSVDVEGVLTTSLPVSTSWSGHVHLAESGVLTVYGRDTDDRARLIQLDLDSDTIINDLTTATHYTPMALSPTHDEVYFLANEALEVIDLTQPGTPELFAYAAPGTLQVLGDVLLVEMLWDLWIFDRKTGHRLAAVKSNSDDGNHRLFAQGRLFGVTGGALFYRDFDPEAGTISDTIAHTTSSYIAPPLFLMPGGEEILTGAGGIFDLDLNYVGAIGHDAEHLTFIDSEIFIARMVQKPGGSVTEVYSIDSGYTKDAARDLPGKLLQLFSWHDELIVVINDLDGATNVFRFPPSKLEPW